MQIKLNCDNRGILQGEVRKLTEGKFLLKSKEVTIPCRVDCRIDGIKEGDFVQVNYRLRYSNDNETHKLILEKVRHCKVTDTPVNQIAIEGYAIEPINSREGYLSYMFRNNTLTSSGEVYRCLIEVESYGAVAKRLTTFIKPESLYMVVGELVSKGKKITINAEYAKDSKAITRDI
jgi:hypothetical protein